MHPNQYFEESRKLLTGSEVKTGRSYGVKPEAGASAETGTAQAMPMELDDDALMAAMDEAIPMEVDA